MPRGYKIKDNPDMYANGGQQGPPVTSQGQVTKDSQGQAIVMEQKKAMTTTSQGRTHPFVFDDGQSYFMNIEAVSVKVSPVMRKQMLELAKRYGIQNGPTLIRFVIHQYYKGIADLDMEGLRQENQQQQQTTS